MRTYMTVICCLIGLAVKGQNQHGDYTYVRPLFDFDHKKPLFIFTADQLTNANRYLRYYALTGYREGVATTSGPFNISFATVDYKSSGTRLLYMYNVSIGEIVTHRVGESDRIIYEVRDPSRYRYLTAYGPREQWLRKNGLCFELLLPVSSMNIQLVDSLISKRLGITWNRQKRQVNALVLSRLSKGGKLKFQYIKKSSVDVQGKFTVVTFAALGTALALDGRPFIDETGYAGLIDLDLKFNDPKDLTVVNRQLRRYDLVVKQEMRDLDMLVVREVNYKDK